MSPRKKLRSSQTLVIQSPLPADSSQNNKSEVTEGPSELNILINTVNKLVEANGHLSRQVENLLGVVETLLSSRSPTTTQAQFASVVAAPFPLPKYNDFVTFQDVQERIEKKKDSSIVLVGCEETPDENLLQAVRSKLTAANIPEDSVVDCHRHGRVKPDGGDRIIKIHVAKKEYYRDIKYCIGTSGLGKYSRKDMTRGELNYNRALRNWCREMNAAGDGKKMYKVIDNQCKLVDVGPNKKAGSQEKIESGMRVNQGVTSPQGV